MLVIEFNLDGFWAVNLDGFWAGSERLSKVLAANEVEIIGNTIDNPDILND
jgi:hypothetical protein